MVLLLVDRLAYTQSLGSETQMIFRSSSANDYLEAEKEPDEMEYG